jgi:hypothetical protein
MGAGAMLRTIGALPARSPAFHARALDIERVRRGLCHCAGEGIAVVDVAPAGTGSGTALEDIFGCFTLLEIAELVKRRFKTPLSKTHNTKTNCALDIVGYFGSGTSKIQRLTPSCQRAKTRR